MRQQDIWTATELSEELIAAIDEASADNVITSLTLASWIVEANTAQAALDAVPWDALRSPETFDNSAAIGAWVREHGPKEAAE